MKNGEGGGGGEEMIMVDGPAIKMGRNGIADGGDVAIVSGIMNVVNFNAQTVDLCITTRGS